MSANIFNAERHEEANELRQQAAQLIRQAAEIDGLLPYAIVHEHRFGTSLSVAWCPEFPLDEDQVAEFMGSSYEPDRNESLTVLDLDAIHLKGAQICVIDTSEEVEEV
jgi:hypothetical protein